MRRFSVGFLWSDAWNFCKSLKLMFTTIVWPFASVFSVCFTCLLINIDKDEWYIQQNMFAVFLILYIVLHFLSHWLVFFVSRKFVNKKIKCAVFSIKLGNGSAFFWRARKAMLKINFQRPWICKLYVNIFTLTFFLYIFLKKHRILKIHSTICY